MSGLGLQVMATTCVYTDHGSKAANNVAIYQPTVPAGYWALGSIAVNTGNNSYPISDTGPLAQLAVSAIVITPLDDPDVILPVSSASATPTLLWTNQDGSGQAGDQSIELWQFTADGYTALGLLAVVGAGFGGSPSANPLFAQMALVSNDLVVEAALGPSMIWDDHNTGANGAGQWQDVAYWPVIGGAVTMPFVAAEGYSIPPSSPTSPTPNALLQVHSSARLP